MGRPRLFVWWASHAETRVDGSYNKLAWLTGAWLDQSIEKPVSPFAMKSSDLVPSHLIEPVVSVFDDKSKLQPWLGDGVADFRRQSGPLSVMLYQQICRELVCAVERSSDRNHDGV